MYIPVILVREVKVTSRTVNETLSLIESENASISIPREVFSVVKERTLIRVASTLFRNMTGCLPERISQGKAGLVDDVRRPARLLWQKPFALLVHNPAKG